MKTILPKGFNFSSGKILTPDRIDTDDSAIFLNKNINIILLIGIILFSVGLIAFLFLALLEKDTLSLIGLMSFFLGLVTIFATFLISISNPHKFDDNCEFRLQPNSNLIVKQDTTGDNSYGNIYPITGEENKTYPYKVYVRNSISGKLIYLGHAKHNKVFLNDETATGKLFIKYNQYIDEHNLRNKFVKTLKFERDSSIKDADGFPQYVLKGDGIILKVKSLQSQKYQVYVEKD